MSNLGGGGAGSTRQNIYRSSTLGDSLQESIKDLRAQYPDEISEDLAGMIMADFDRVVAEKFRELPATQSSAFKVKLHGNCKSYNNCDDVWKFMLNQCEIKGELVHVTSEACNIIAMEAATKENEVRKEAPKKAKPGNGGGGGYQNYRGGNRNRGSNGFKQRGGRR